APADPLASPPARLGPTDQRLDPRVSRRGECRPRNCAHPREWGDHPPDPAAPGHQLAAGQALDHQSRSGIRPKKGGRDRLIALAEQPPDWGLSFADETWWSRFARPHLHTWADEADGPLHLVEQDVPKSPTDSPDPKALACYGVLLRQRSQPERVWLR